MANISNHLVELPPGVRHESTVVTAMSWEAYDRLLDEGWEHRSWFLDLAGRPCSEYALEARLHEQRDATIRGHHITCLPPSNPRPTDPTVGIVRGILAESMEVGHV